MDLLGGYNSESDSDSDESDSPEIPVAAAAATTAAPSVTAATISERSSRLIPASRDTKLPPPTTTSRADKRKRVIGKKLLKLSAVLPEHILNQLQKGGGGYSKARSNEFDGDDTDDSSEDNDDDSDDDDDNEKEPSSSRNTIKSTAASSKNYSRDEGLMGLLSELSKSNSSSSSSKKLQSSKILGNEVPTLPSSDPPTKEPPKSDSNTTSTSSAPLGAAFLTTTVQTIKRKRSEPSAVRSIHETTGGSKEGTSSSSSVHAANPSTAVPRPSQSTVAARPLRINSTPSVRSAAPRVGIPSTQHGAYAPVVHRSNYTGHEEEQSHAYEQKAHHTNRTSATGGRTHTTKKKPLSRKRQMEQMLRAGRLDQVQGDHELSGVSHVYHQDADLHAGSAAMSSSSSGVGVRVVPTGAYDSSLGKTAVTTDVTSRQKTSNQLNSLLANAASLESHRAQNPQYHLMGGARGKSGSHRATAKRKYGW